MASDLRLALEKLDGHIFVGARPARSYVLQETTPLVFLPMDDITFQTRVQAARSGDKAAAADLFREYQPELQRYIRFRLTHREIRRFVDSFDICQSVLAAFFVHLKSGQIDNIVNPAQLFGLLNVMAQNKIKDKVRYHGAARRNNGTAHERMSIEMLDVPSSDPDPHYMAAGREILSIVREQVRPQDREALELWLSGNGWTQIASTLGGTPDARRKQVERSIEHVAQKLGVFREAV